MKKITKPLRLGGQGLIQKSLKTSITTNSSSSKPKKQAHTSFLNHKGGFHNNTKYPRYGNWILEVGEDWVYTKRDIYKAIQEYVSYWVEVTEYPDLKTPSDRKKLKDRLNQILLDCVNTGKASGDCWVIRFGEDE